MRMIRDRPPPHAVSHYVIKRGEAAGTAPRMHGKGAD